MFNHQKHIDHFRLHGKLFLMAIFTFFPGTCPVRRFFVWTSAVLHVASHSNEKLGPLTQFFLFCNTTQEYVLPAIISLYTFLQINYPRGPLAYMYNLFIEILVARFRCTLLMPYFFLFFDAYFEEYFFPDMLGMMRSLPHR